MNPQNMKRRLQRHKVKFDDPLTIQEISRIEAMYDITFPPDLREFYQCGLPVSEKFPNWRNTSEMNINSLRERLAWSLDGMLFDVEHNSFWYPAWGERPGDLEAAFHICRKEFSKVPQLIPVYSHRYISSQPEESGNPIFSVYQTDIIYYGEDLENYFKVEFSDKDYSEIDYKTIKKIQFWSDLVE